MKSTSRKGEVLRRYMNIYEYLKEINILEKISNMHNHETKIKIGRTKHAVMLSLNHTNNNCSPMITASSKTYIVKNSKKK